MMMIKTKQKERHTKEAEEKVRDTKKVDKKRGSATNG